MFQCRESKKGPNNQKCQPLMDSQFSQSHLQSQFQKVGQNRDSSVKKTWTQQDNRLIAKLYNEHGGYWTELKLSFPQKSASDVKNRVNNSIRKLAGTLSGNHNYKTINRPVSTQKLLAMLNMAFQTERFTKKLQLTPNPKSMLVDFKNDLINVCFSEGVSEEDIKRLLGKISRVNYKMKCFSNFKAKNQKAWKLSLKTYKNVLNFDKPFLEQNIDVTARFNEINEQNQCRHSTASEDSKNHKHDGKGVKIEDNSIQIEEIKSKEGYFARHKYQPIFFITTHFQLEEGVKLEPQPGSELEQEKLEKPRQIQPQKLYPYVAFIPLNVCKKEYDEYSQ